jgi:hypothetical protein
LFSAFSLACSIASDGAKRLAIGDRVTDERSFRDAILACDEGDRSDLDGGEKDATCF